MIKKILRFGLLVFLIGVVSGASWGKIPPSISFSGRLTDANGGPVNDTLDMKFSIWSELQGGTELWSETYSGLDSVNIDNGVFNVILGSKGSPIPLEVFDDPTVYLDIDVGNNGTSMIPRQMLVSVPFAFHALRAETAGVAGGWQTDASTKTVTNYKVGIGTPDPMATLTLNSPITNLGVGVPALEVGNPGGNAGVFVGSDLDNFVGMDWFEGKARIYTSANDTLLLQPASGGYVGIGTNIPEFKLDVQKDDGVSAADGIGHHGVAWMSRQSANDGPGLYMGYVADGTNVTGAFIRQGGTGNGILDIGTLGNKRAIRIDSSGNVGINKTDLDNRAKLQIGADWGHLRLYEQDQPYPGEFTQLDRNGGGFNIAHYVGESKTYVHVLTGARNGNVGIGTTSPGAELEVKSEGGQPDIWLNRGTNASAAVFSLRTGGVNDWSILTPSGGDNLYIYNKNNNKLMEFTQGGTVLMDNPTHLLEVTNTRIGTISPASAADWSRKVPMIRTLLLRGRTNAAGTKYWTSSQTGLGGNEAVISITPIVYTSNDTTVANKIQQSDPDPLVKFWGYNSGVPGEVSINIGRNEIRDVAVFLVYEGL